MKKVPRVSALCDFLTGGRGVRHDFPAAAQVRHSPEQEERRHLPSAGIRPRFAFPGFESVMPYSDETFFPISKRIDNTSPSSGRRKLAARRNLVFAEGVSFPRIPPNLRHREPVMRRKFSRVRVFGFPVGKPEAYRYKDKDSSVSVRRAIRRVHVRNHVRNTRSVSPAGDAEPRAWCET